MSPLISGDPTYNGVVLSDGGIWPNSHSSKCMSRVLLHHDDLITKKPTIDVNLPIKSILRECESLVKQSNVSLEFGRPDIALQQYLQASIIAIEIIPRHKEFCDLKYDRSELYKLYNSLTERIKSQDAKFVEAKKIIKKNNFLHGTQPATSRGTRSKSQFSRNPAEEIEEVKIDIPSLHFSDLDTSKKLSKQPPVIQPKPKALHGHIIQASKSLSSQHQKDELAARFARLRSAEPNSPKQDPRIRTQPILAAASAVLNNKTSISTQKCVLNSRPFGPRDMPSVPKTKPDVNMVLLDAGIPGLPRAPDAIYSPARGTEIITTSNLHLSLRSNLHKINGHQSAPPVSQVVPSSIKVNGRETSLSLSHRSGQLSELAEGQRDKRIVLPNSNFVTCEELVGLLAQGTQVLNILLVDLRSREAYDNGHILSQSIICVEPITLRPGISGEELADSMVIAPDAEQLLFERRNEFDILVVYDQSSTIMSENSKLVDFTTAVYDYGYEKKLKRPPLLLISGLNGWTDLLGPKSLATSSTGSSIRSNNSEIKIARPLTHAVHESQSSLSLRQKRHYSRPLTMEQESIWATTIKDELANTPPDYADVVDELVYARTMEDFIRRYPELPTIQESMISSPASNIYQDQLLNVIQRPPARPAPAIPRQRSSGISEKCDSLSYVHTIPNSESTISETQRPPGLTGLSNPRVLCYMNTVIQGLSATSWFRELIKNYVHPASPPIPKREGEKTDPPQLMVRCLSSIFAHLWIGQYEYINPTTFQGYVNAVHNQGPRGFGGSQVQHDCNEFLVMLIDILDDELNPLRNLPGRRPIEEIEGMLEKAPTILDAAAIYWIDWTSNLGSPITHRMKGVTVRILRCDLCGKSRPVFDQFQQLLLAVPSDGACTLNDILDASYGPKSELIEYQSLQCSNCCKNTSQRGRVYLVYMPDTLIISFMRMTNNLAKIKTRITVPLTIDFGGNVVLNQNASQNQDYRCKGPFVYDVYGLGLHSGNTLASGHYRMLARSLDQLAVGKPAGFWHMFDDQLVTPFNMTAVDPSEISLIFLQRQGRL